MGLRFPRAWSRMFASHALTPLADSSGAALAEAVTGPAGGAEGMWLYAVPDDDTDADSQVVLSMVYNGDVYTGALDLSGFSGTTGVAGVVGSVSWSQVDLSSAGSSATDRAHIFAEGAHWMSHSIDADTELWLLQLTPADARGGGAAVTPTAVVKVYSESDNTALFYNPRWLTGAHYLINDHFLVHVPGGIAVGIWRTGEDRGDRSLKIVVVSTSTLARAGQHDIGGSGIGVDCNVTGSARQVPEEGTGGRELQILVPEKIGDTTIQNNLYLLTTDDAFTAPTAATATYTETDQHLQMGSFLRLANGDYVVAYKRIPIGGYYSGDGGTTEVYSDWGDVILAVLDPSMSTTVLWSELCLEAGATVDLPVRAGNRPHVARWRRYVITCWDTVDLTPGSEAPAGSYLRIDWLEAS